jgi:YidC/Oxa1 family membrane protein insertase
MNDIRRTILWVIFGFSMILLWDQWQVYNGHKATFFPHPESQASAPAASTSNAVTPTTVNPAVSTVVPVTATPTAVPKERFDVTTDVLKLTLDTEGGSLVRAELLKFADTVDKTHNFVLLDDSKDRIYLAQSGVVAGAGGGPFPTHKTVMTASGPHTLADGQDELVIKFTSPDVGGLRLV